MNDDGGGGGGGGKWRHLHAALPPARAVTRLQKYDFAMDYFCGSNDLASKGKWVTFAEVWGNGEAFYDGINNLRAFKW